MSDPRRELIQEANKLAPLLDPGPKLSETELDRHLTEKGFRIGAKIGGGSYGTVYRATWDKKPDQELAVKVVDVKKSRSRAFLVKFFPREIYFLSKMAHVNVTRCFHIEGPYNATYWIFMELCMGGDLLDWIRIHGSSVAESQARIWFKQIVKGLNYIHSQGVAHRDLKLENILIDEFGTVKISDFGFARPALDAQAQVAILSRTYCGSAVYVAPEVIVNRPYNPLKSDVWSIGVVLFVVLNNRFPFNDKDMNKMYKKQLAMDYTFSSRVVNTLSAEAKDLVKSILVPSPADRPSLRDIYAHPWLAQDILNA